jgi:hypothetical protein
MTEGSPRPKISLLCSTVGCEPSHIVQKSRISHQIQALDRFALFRCINRVQNQPMIEQDKQSWNKGRADAMRGAPSKPKGLDALADRPRLRMLRHLQEWLRAKLFKPKYPNISFEP